MVICLLAVGVLGGAGLPSLPPSLVSFGMLLHRHGGWNEAVLGTCSKMKAITAFLHHGDPGIQGFGAQVLSACRKPGLAVCICKFPPQGHSPGHDSLGSTGELLHESVLSARAHAWTRAFIFSCLCTSQTPVYKGSSLTLGRNRSLAHKGESEGKCWCLACGPHGC